MAFVLAAAVLALLLGGVSLYAAYAVKRFSFSRSEEGQRQEVFANIRKFRRTLDPDDPEHIRLNALEALVDEEDEVAHSIMKGKEIRALEEKILGE